MNLALRRKPGATPIQGVVGSAAWLLRWLLVLLLLVDQIGSPLHRHHHDTGADSSAIRGQHLGALPAASHVEDDNHEPSVFHVVTTLRAQSRVSASGTPDQADTQAVALDSARALSWPKAEPSGTVSWAAAPAPPHPLHRSLPPASRAPPWRA